MRRLPEGNFRLIGDGLQMHGGGRLLCHARSLDDSALPGRIQAAFGLTHARFAQ
jgi:hypothetical protein